MGASAIGPYVQAIRDTLHRFGVNASEGVVGTNTDNALAEAFNATLKREVRQERAVFADSPPRPPQPVSLDLAVRPIASTRPSNLR